MKDIIPYGQHYRISKQMLGDSSAYCVLEHLIDECTYYSKIPGSSVVLHLDKSKIAAASGIEWKTASKGLERLREMKLISYDEEEMTYEIHFARYISLVQAFLHLDRQKRAKFCKALRNNDEKTLEALGYEYCVDLAYDPSEYVGKITQPSVKLPTSLSNYPILCQMTQLSVKRPISMSNDTTLGKMTEDCVKLQPIITKCNRATTELASQICSKYDKDDIKSVILHTFPQFAQDNEQLDVFLEELYSGEELQYSPWMFLLSFCCMENDRTVGNFTHKPMSNDIPEINNVNRHVTSLSSQEEREDNQEKEGNMENSSFSDNNGFEEIELLPAIKINQEAINRSKRRDNLPFLTSSEMDMFTQSPDLVVDRPDALFIFQLWTILKEHFIQDVEDEDGNVSEKQVNPDGQYIPVEVFLKNILGPAFDATEDAIRMGKLECEKGTFQLSIPQDFQLSVDDMFMIPDFNRMKTDDDDYFQISYDRFHDITAKDTEESGKPEGMRESEYNKRYLQEIVKTEDDEDRFSQLTDMEYFVYVFLGQYFKIDDTTKEIIDVLDEYQDRKYVTGRELARYFMEHTEVSKDDFLGILKTPLNEGALDLKPVGLFSADKIRKWNRLHKQKSIIEI